MEMRACLLVEMHALYLSRPLINMFHRNLFMMCRLFSVRNLANTHDNELKYQTIVILIVKTEMGALNELCVHFLYVLLTL